MIPDMLVVSWMPQWASTPLMGAVVSLSIVAAVALIAYLVLRPIILRILNFLAAKSPVSWDDVLVEQKVWHRLTVMVPLLFLRAGMAWAPAYYPQLQSFIARFIEACMILVIIRTIDALLSSVNEIYSRGPLADRRPIKSYIQLIKLFLYLIAGILMIARLSGQTPWFFLGGIGAMTAVLMLVFRDTILSLVASIQLTNNNLIQLGDWIEMPQFNADGDVVDIALNTVKVQNWDKTVTVIPTHKFLENSFKNWRGMHDSGGRRIKRAIYIDTSTIRFLTPEEIERFSNFVLLKTYIAEKRKELESYNAPYADNPDAIVNARRLTNIGTFRAYVINYLKTHPSIHQGMTQLVRQLQPTPEGVPLEIYAFTNSTRWAVYEGVQGDVFDHLLAIAPEFGLRIYQRPSGQDFSSLGSRIAG